MENLNVCGCFEEFLGWGFREGIVGGYICRLGLYVWQCEDRIIILHHRAGSLCLV